VSIEQIETQMSPVQHAGNVARSRSVHAQVEMFSRFTASVGGVIVALRCASRLEARAHALFAHLRKAQTRGTRIVDGATVTYGGSLLAFVRGTEGVLELREPDFDGDPFSSTRGDLTSTLTTVDTQLELLARASAPARTTMFWETLTVAGGALGMRRVYVERKKRLGGVRDSGWTIGPLDGEDDKQETRFVHEIVSRRPALAAALAFPEGWLVVFDGDRVHAVLDPDGSQRWPRQRARSTLSG
jgi:hypothetical protein